MFQLAIDGTAAAGKGTLAMTCSQILDFMYVDTGAMYRGVALHALRQGLSDTDVDGHTHIAQELDFEFHWKNSRLRIMINNEDCTDKIRTEVVGERASVSSAFLPVREALLQQQRNLGRSQSIVMDGRDIGTVVLPDADLKIYVDADITVRAKRRLKDVKLKNPDAQLDAVLADLKRRDHRDMNREVAPLKCAADAIRLDTTNISIVQGVCSVVSLYFKKTVPNTSQSQFSELINAKLEIGPAKPGIKEINSTRKNQIQRLNDYLQSNTSS